jgi:hypothetical protein
MSQLSIPILTVVTLVLAVVIASSLFKLYHLCLMGFIRSMGWELEALKNYQVTPGVKKWDQLAQAIVMLGILWKVFYT